MKKVYLSLMVVSVVIFIVGFNYSESQATARATAGVFRTSVMAATNCRSCTPCINRAAGVGNNAVFCNSGPNGNGTFAQASAWARVPLRVAVGVHIFCAPQDWAWAKDIPYPPDTVVDADTFDVRAAYAASKCSIFVKGLVKLYPAWCGNEWDGFEVAAYESGTQYTAFSGWGKLWAGGSVGTIRADSTVVHPHDSLYVYYDWDTVVAYTGNSDSLMVELYKTERTWNVPTTTQWGVIVLVGLIVASAVFIMLRRRKAVPA